MEEEKTDYRFYADKEEKKARQDRNVHDETAGDPTAGLSLGATRQLVLHSLDGTPLVRCLQKHGDAFAFDSDANRPF